jgi:hypothetical protein
LNFKKDKEMEEWNDANKKSYKFTSYGLRVTGHFGYLGYLGLLSYCVNEEMNRGIDGN